MHSKEKYENYTTIEIFDLKKVKMFALEHDLTLKDFVNQAIKNEMNRVV